MIGKINNLILTLQVTYINFKAAKIILNDLNVEN